MTLAFSVMHPYQTLLSAWSAMRAAYRADEGQIVATLHGAVAITSEQNARIAKRATSLASGIRERTASSFNAEAFLSRYRLSTREGVVLMCLAEAFLRIPDERTIDELLLDKLSGTDWSAAADDGPLLLNASAWGLMLSGKLASWQDEPGAEPWSLLKNLVARMGEPLVRAAIKHAMRIMAEQFVIGETIAQAVVRVAETGRYTYSFDMLGEAARTRGDADRYFESYREAIDIAGAAATAVDLHARPGISVKLSALHPRYEVAKKRRVMSELLPRLRELGLAAKARNVSLTVDAEESERLTLSLALFEQVLRDAKLGDWPGFGLAVQAYQKRAFYAIDWLQALASATRRRIMVRLVKGAYWDSEIKIAQQQGVADYPVFTRKAATDLAYIACAQKLLAAKAFIYPQFATHNSRSLATILELAGNARDFEFQKLYGMGDALYEQVLEQDTTLNCRVYAPVGRHQELLPYLVRRILENGANSSFVHQIGDATIPLAALVADPLAATAPPYKRNTAIPLPPLLYAERKNSRALDLSDEHELEAVAALVATERAQAQTTTAASDAGGAVREPNDTRCVVGIARKISVAELDAMVAAAEHAAPQWVLTTVESRAALLERAADLMEQRMLPLISLCVREAGKTLADAHSEVREAVDYCRYYALRARQDLAVPLVLQGPTGESNQLTLHARGVFACISPWNFPLAIFTGQVAAALVAGNAVIAKPAEQTPLIAQAAVALLHEAGVPYDVLQLACGAGTTIGARLVAHRGIAGVVFTGSVDTARAINQSLAARTGPIIPLIAETGGQNAMIVDSSALAEQVVADAMVSAFNSAGQRCSALRLLFLQDEIAPRVIEMLRGAMLELELGDPASVATDIGPVIDAEAQSALLTYIAKLMRTGTLIAEAALPVGLEQGHYVAPIAVEIAIADIPDHEVFGPVLHVIRYRADELDEVLDALNNTGYALTLGIQSRIDRFTDRIRACLGVGNAYVNRNMIGAVVGVQPFGGERLSGTGPKAGGPYYLPRFVVERTLTVNTAAVGGNASLLSRTSGQ